MNPFIPGPHLYIPDLGIMCLGRRGKGGLPLGLSVEGSHPGSGVVDCPRPGPVAPAPVRFIALGEDIFPGIHSS